MTAMLFGYAALGLIITFILAAWIPAGKVPEEPENKDDASDEEIKKARQRLSGRSGL